MASLRKSFRESEGRTISLATASRIVNPPGLDISGMIQPESMPEITIADSLRAGVNLISGRLCDHATEYRDTL